VWCRHHQTLIFHEVFMTGWSASLNGDSVGITPYDKVYQQVRVPAGTSTVSFNFTPPYMVVGFVAFLSGLACLIASLIWRRGKHHRAPRAKTVVSA
jgi:uncharacterized membrane protein YfhO